MMDATGLDNSSTKGSGRRRSSNLVLRPAFQWKYTVAVVLGVFLVSAFIGIELFGVLYQQARARVLYQPTVNGAEIRTAILLSTLAFALLPAVGFGVWAMFVTHRICGPLEVMEHCLNELKRGRFPKHRSLRKRDEFKDFHDVLWGAIRALEVGKRSELAALANVLQTARSAAAADDRACRKALEDIAPHIEVLCAEAAYALGEDYRPVGKSPEASSTRGAKSDREYAEAAH